MRNIVLIRTSVRIVSRLMHTYKNFKKKNVKEEARSTMHVCVCIYIVRDYKKILLACLENLGSRVFNISAMIKPLPEQTWLLLRAR